MSRRNSRAAEAARRAAGPLYPVMPPGECYGSSAALAACYPELRYAEGIRTFTVRVLPDGHAESSAVEHAWNVTSDGKIWDSTLDPEMRVAARRCQVEITYAEGEDTQAGKWDGVAALVAGRVAGLTGERKRKAIESAGRLMAAQPG